MYKERLSPNLFSYELHSQLQPVFLIFLSLSLNLKHAALEDLWGCALS